MTVSLATALLNTPDRSGQPFKQALHQNKSIGRASVRLETKPVPFRATDGRDWLFRIVVTVRGWSRRFPAENSVHDEDMKIIGEWRARPKRLSSRLASGEVADKSQSGVQD